MATDNQVTLVGNLTDDPELRYTPNGAAVCKLRMAVNRLPSSGEHRGSLLVNPGGPGVSGLHYARAARSIVSPAVREHYDVVGFDPRGVGATRPIDCLSDRDLDTFLEVDGTPDSPAEEQELVRAIRTVGKGESLLDPAVTNAVLDRLRKGKRLLED